MFKNFSWTNILTDEEKKELEFGISSTYAFTLLFLTSLAGLIVLFSNVFVGLAIILLGYVYFLYLRKGKHFIFTDKRIVMVDAFIGKEIISVDYSQITDIQMEQSPFELFAGWGNLAINTAGTHSPEIKLSFIDNPQKVKLELDSIRGRINGK